MVLAVLFFLTACIGFQPVIQAATAAPIARHERQEIVRQAQQTVNDVVPRIPEMIQAGNDAIERHKQAEIDHIKWGNTVRWQTKITLPWNGPSIPVGFYNKDFATLARIPLTIGAVYYLVSKAYDVRIEHVFENICEHSTALRGKIEALTRAAKEENVDVKKQAKNFVLQSSSFFFKKRASFASWFKKSPKTDSAGRELVQYLKNTHQLIGYNPFKKELLPSLALVAGGEQASHWIKERFFTNNPFKTETFAAYDAQGNVVENAPLSTSAIIAPIDNAASYMGKGMAALSRRLAIQYYCPWLPSWALSKPCAAAISLLFMGYALKAMDGIYDNLWCTHAIANHQELNELLITYEQAHKEHQEDESAATKKKLQDSECALKKFIQKGHKISWMPGYSSRLWNGLRNQPYAIVASGIALYTYYRFVKMMFVLAP